MLSKIRQDLSCPTIILNYTVTYECFSTFIDLIVDFMSEKVNNDLIYMYVKVSFTKWHVYNFALKKSKVQCKKASLI